MLSVRPHQTQRPQPKRSRREGFMILPILAGLGITAFHSQAADNSEAARPSSALELTQLSFEELGQIKVTSVSKKSERLSGAAAAVHVITQDDIRRSGVTSLAAALRMAPGLTVAQANARQWAISARGFNDIFANRLLVLMDGRTLYTPLFSGEKGSRLLTFFFPFARPFATFVRVPMDSRSAIQRHVIVVSVCNRAAIRSVFTSPFNRLPNSDSFQPASCNIVKSD